MQHLRSARAKALPLIAAFVLLICAGPAFAAAVHIVAFGDSATAGYLVPHEQAYPAQLQAALRKKGYNVTVKNAGISGDTTVGALARFDTAIEPRTDIAIVEFGTNDLHFGSSLADIRARLTRIIGALRARGVQVLLVGLGQLDLSSVASANGTLYAQWKLPRGKYRAGDGQHFNDKGYAILVARMLPQIESLMNRKSPK
ncbi:MAG: GDSL-type esterase/lipase family protein [Bradyrhizobium sp.]